LAEGRRVHNNTLSACGSPDATPSGYSSRRSVHVTRDLAAPAFAKPLRANAATAPIEAAAARNSLRETFFMIHLARRVVAALLARRVCYSLGLLE
jgi:hypothetical protein